MSNMRTMILLVFLLSMSGTLSASKFAIPKKTGIIKVFNTASKEILAETIDKKMLEDIIKVERRVDSISSTLSSFNKYDTSEYELVSLYLKQLQNYKELLQSKYDEWKLKYGELKSGYTDNLVYDDFGTMMEKRYYIVKNYSVLIKPNEVIERGDSSYIELSSFASNKTLTIIDNESKKLIYSYKLGSIENSSKIFTNVITDSLSVYYDSLKNRIPYSSKKITIVVSDSLKQLDKFSTTYVHAFYPTQGMQYDGYQASAVIDDSALFQMQSDSLDALIRNNKSKTFALLKIVIAKSHERTPEAIAIAESSSQEIQQEIDQYDVRMPVYRDLKYLKELLKRYDEAKEKVNKAHAEWEQENGAGYPVEYVYHSKIVINGGGWNFESDDIESFEVLGNGKNLTIEFIEKGTKKPFLEYEIPELNGSFELDIDELKQNIGEYLNQEGSSFLTDYSSNIIIRIKQKQKVISTFEVFLSAQVG
jgi:hypothetical protein